MTEKTDRCPQEVAAAVLETIGRSRVMFNMRSWIIFGEATDRFFPEDDPLDCGTSLCAAGLAAHEGGWTIFRSGGHVSAVKNGRELPIPTAAEESLGLTPEQGKMIWYESEEAAYDFLKEIATTGGLLT